MDSSKIFPRVFITDDQKKTNNSGGWIRINGWEYGASIVDFVIYLCYIGSLRLLAISLGLEDLSKPAG